MKWMFVLLAVLFPVFALAQDASHAAGLAQVPDYIWALVAPAVGWLTKEIASPLTSLLKKRLGFQGDATRYVYIVLSTAFLVGYGLFVHAYGAGSASWWTAAGAYLTAIIKGFGDYQKQVDAARAGGSASAVSDPSAGLIPVSWAEIQETAAHDEVIPLVQP